MMAENKMPAVAHLLGRRLGERFTVDFYGVRFDCWFIGGGFEVIDAPPFTHCFDEEVLYGLITGEAVIIGE